MPIRRASDFIEAYRFRADARDAHEMSGRGKLHHLTRFVNDQIVEHLALSPSDVVLDVGCGDGSLLASISGRIGSGVGIAPTDEEVRRLRDEHRALSNLQFRTGRAEQLSAEPGVYTRVVCNGVLLLLDDQAAVGAAIRALLDACAPGGRVWLGEVPDRDEAAFTRAAYGDSLLRWLLHSFRRGGLVQGTRVALVIARALVTREPLIVQPKRCTFLTPEQMNALLAGLPCRLLWRGPYRPPIAGFTEPTRWHYLVERT